MRKIPFGYPDVLHYVEPPHSVRCASRLVVEMFKNTDVARLVTSLLHRPQKGIANSILITFNAATLRDFIKESKSLTEGTAAYVVPAPLVSVSADGKRFRRAAVEKMLRPISGHWRACLSHWRRRTLFATPYFDSLIDSV